MFESMTVAYSREAVDEVAERFCHVNNKASRRRLLRETYALHRNDQALIPYYCRLVAALAKIYPDLGAECAQIFRAEFFRLLRRSHDSGTVCQMGGQ